MTMGLSKNDLLEGRYRIFARIGEGGMGVVYAAEHVALHRKCAIKVLHPSEARDEMMIARFRIEAQAAANIRHVNIVEVMDFGITPDNRPFFVMEFLDGESLADRLDRTSRLEDPDALRITKQILDGLAAAHRVRVVHRDLKPENIFLAVQGDGKEIVKVLDFGISKIVAGTPSRPPAPISGNHKVLTQKGVVFGTPGYMAPETLFGTEIIDSRADLFSVAVILFEMLVGKRPFQGRDPQATMIATASKPAPSILSFRPELSTRLDEVILKGLSKDPQYRYQTAEQFAEAIVALRKRPKPRRPSPPTTRNAAETAAASEPIELADIAPEERRKRSPVERDYGQGARRRPGARLRRLSFALSPYTLLFFAAVGGLTYYYVVVRQPLRTVSNEDPIDTTIANKVRAKGAADTPAQEAIRKPIETVTIWLDASPEELQVTFGDRVVYERPLIVQKSPLTTTVRFSKDGYRDETRQIVPDQEQTIIVRLKKIEKDKRRKKR